MDKIWPLECIMAMITFAQWVVEGDYQWITDRLESLIVFHTGNVEIISTSQSFYVSQWMEMHSFLDYLLSIM